MDIYKVYFLLGLLVAVIYLAMLLISDAYAAHITLEPLFGGKDYTHSALCLLKTEHIWYYGWCAKV